MQTDHFYIAGLDNINVWLDQTYWGHSLNKETPAKKTVSVPLEMIHAVVYLGETGLILFPPKMFKLGKR